MKIELTPDAAVWVQAEVDAGTFPTPEDAVRHAVNLAKLAALRETVAASLARGGANTAEDVLTHINKQLAERTDTSKTS